MFAISICPSFDGIGQKKLFICTRITTTTYLESFYCSDYKVSVALLILPANTCNLFETVRKNLLTRCLVNCQSKKEHCQSIEKVEMLGFLYVFWPNPNRININILSKYSFYVAAFFFPQAKIFRRAVTRTFHSSTEILFFNGN